MPYLSEDLRKLFDEFYRANPSVEYFMLDGSHKTTAATLTNNKIRVMVFESDHDVERAKALAEIGDLFNFYLKGNIEGIVEELIEHFDKDRKFETVEQKTQRMVTEKVVPRYMIDFYNG